MKKSCNGKRGLVKPSLPMGNLLNFGLSSRSAKEKAATTTSPAGYVKTAVNRATPSSKLGQSRCRSTVVCGGNAEKKTPVPEPKPLRPKYLFRTVQNQEKEEQVATDAEYDAPWENAAISACLNADHAIMAKRLLHGSVLPPTVVVTTKTQAQNDGCAYDEPWESKVHRLLADHHVDLLLGSPLNSCGGGLVLDEPPSDDHRPSARRPPPFLEHSAVPHGADGGNHECSKRSDQTTTAHLPPIKGAVPKSWAAVSSSPTLITRTKAADVVMASDSYRTCDRATQTYACDPGGRSQESVTIRNHVAAANVSRPVPPLRISVLKNRLTGSAAGGGGQPTAQAVSDIPEASESNISLHPPCKTQLGTASSSDPTTRLQEPSLSVGVQYDVPWEFCCSDFHASAFGPSGQDGRTLPKVQTTETRVIGSGGGVAEGDKIASAIVNSSLAKQEWFHGAISRAEAERRLRSSPQGSFLVRVCEGCKAGKEYALSVRHLTGFMHMKIQLNQDRKWILGYFSQPFDSVAQMLRYYASNKLPIKGAEHITLVQPVIDQVV